MRKVTLFYFIVLMVACNSNSDQPREIISAEEDSITVDKQDVALPDENLAIINETGFSKYARLSIPQLNWSKFTITKFWKEEFQNRTAFAAEKNYFDLYGPFLKYSPDSSKFIDLDSYNVAITKNNRGQLSGESQGPETEISLIDLKKKEKMQLAFLGPGNSIEDAAWIDNDNLILIGYLENDSATGINAAIWQFNLSSKNVNLYELSDDAVLKTLRNYSEKVRLKSVHIK